MGSRRPNAAKPGLVERLRQHHMFRVASWYATAAYVLVLVANAVFPDVGLTRDDVRYVIAALALGFPLALTLGWIFIPPSQEDPKEFNRWRRLRWRLGTLASMVVTGFVIASGIYLWRVNERHLGNLPTSAAAKSVAVLPFEDLSGNPDNAYFSAGIQDEILTRLAKISALKVVSRTSTLQYASHPENLRKVGVELGVAAVLEGSVQRAGDKARVTVQLIDAASDSHLWADTYDTDMKDIFAAETAIATKVADSMRATLLPTESADIAAVPTQDPVAYDLYLQAEFLFRPLVHGEVPDDRFDDSAVRTVHLYTQAIARDPMFLLAYAHRARTQVFSYWTHNSTDASQLAAARRDAEHALALDPGSPDAHLAMGYVYYFGYTDYAKALLEYDQAARDFPNDAEVILAIAMVHRRLGDTNVIAEVRRAEELDPHNMIQYLGFEASTDGAGARYNDQLQVSERYHQLAPDDPAYLGYRAWVLIFQGHLDEAQRALDRYPPEHHDVPEYASAAYELARLQRRPAAMLQAVDGAHGKDIDSTLPNSVFRGVALHMAGRRAKAAEAFSAAAATVATRLKKSPYNPDLWWAKAYIEAYQGLKAEAVASEQRAMALSPVAKDVLNGTKYLYGLAEVQAINGDVGPALVNLQQVLAGMHGNLCSTAWLRLNPDWDAARKDPAFKALLDKYQSTEQL